MKIVMLEASTVSRNDISFEEICERLNSALPRDIRVLSAAEPVYKNTDIEKSEYEIRISTDWDKLNAFFAQEKIITEKKTKKGISEIDLKPMIEISEMEEGFIRMKLPSGTQTNINANLVFEAFEKQFDMEIDTLNIKRTAVYCQNGEIFR